jgi:predicted PurR-regulated permease PerM
MAKTQKQRDAKSVRSYLTLAFVAAAFVGLIVYGGVKSVESALIWGGITFIVALVGIATLALSVKDDASDPNKPRLK